MFSASNIKFSLKVILLACPPDARCVTPRPARWRTESAHKKKKKHAAFFFATLRAAPQGLASDNSEPELRAPLHIFHCAKRDNARVTHRIGILSDRKNLQGVRERGCNTVCFFNGDGVLKILKRSAETH